MNTKIFGGDGHVQYFVVYAIVQIKQNAYIKICATLYINYTPIKLRNSIKGNIP
jgi:hypothetical protein